MRSSSRTLSEQETRTVRRNVTRCFCRWCIARTSAWRRTSFVNIGRHAATRSSSAWTSTTSPTCSTTTGAWASAWSSRRPAPRQLAAAHVPTAAQGGAVDAQGRAQYRLRTISTGGELVTTPLEQTAGIAGRLPDHVQPQVHVLGNRRNVPTPKLPTPKGTLSRSAEGWELEVDVGSFYLRRAAFARSIAVPRYSSSSSTPMKFRPS